MKTPSKINSRRQVVHSTSSCKMSQETDCIHKSSYNSPLLFSKLWLYTLSGLLILSTNTLYGRLDLMQQPLRIALILAFVITTAALWLRVSVDEAILRRLLCWSVLLVTVLLTVTLLTGKRVGGTAMTFFVLMIIMPLLVYLLRVRKLLYPLLKCYVNTMFVLAIASLFLWFLGPILEIISTNCAISNTWTFTGAEIRTPGYYGLLYETQIQHMGNLTLMRDTGIFVEGPMHSYALCCALLFEVYLCNDRPRLAVISTLTIAVLASLSTTGYIFLIGMVIFHMMRNMPESGPRRIIAVLILTLLVAIGATLVSWLLSEKLGSDLGHATRVDDFVAGYHAWRDSPLFGNGLSDNEPIKAYMSAYRAGNQGLSNSPMVVLARGGILFLLVYLIPFLCYLRSRDINYRIVGILLLYLWLITVVWALPLTALLLSMGLSGMIPNEEMSARNDSALGLRV